MHRIRKIKKPMIKLRIKKSQKSLSDVWKCVENKLIKKENVGKSCGLLGNREGWKILKAKQNNLARRKKKATCMMSCFNDELNKRKLSKKQSLKKRKIN